MTAHRHPSYEFQPTHEEEEKQSMVDDHHKKHVHLWFAVGITMIFVIVFWILLLPMQLEKNQLISDDEASRWKVLRENVVPEFAGQLDDTRMKLEEFTSDLEKQADLNKEDSEKALQDIEEGNYEEEFSDLRNRLETTQEIYNTGE